MHGTYLDGVTLGSAPAHLTGRHSATFDGSTGHVVLPGRWGDIPAMSFEAWINHSRVWDVSAIVSSTGFEGPHFQISPHGHGTGVYSEKGFIGAVAPDGKPLNQWHHLVLVAEPGNVRIHVDGAQFGNSNTIPYEYIRPASDLRIVSASSFTCSSP